MVPYHGYLTLATAFSQSQIAFADRPSVASASHSLAAPYQMGGWVTGGRHNPMEKATVHYQPFPICHRLLLSTSSPLSDTTSEKPTLNIGSSILRR